MASDPLYHKTHSITVKNRLGLTTIFELEQWLDFTPSEVKKLPLTKDSLPIITVKSSSFGRGVINYRTTVAIDNTYNDDFLAIFNDYKAHRPRLKIKIEFTSTVFTQVFLGLLDYEYIVPTADDHNPIIEVDFATGLSLLTDKIFDSTQITEDITGSAISDRRIILDHILSKIFFTEICTYDNDIVYAYGNNLDETLIWLEEWRVPIIGHDTPGITYPTCLLADLLVDLQTVYDDKKTYREVLTDLCQMFDFCVGYSQLLQKPVVHFFMEGATGSNYRLITASGAISHLEERSIASSTHTIASVSSDDFQLKPNPRPRSYEPLNSVNVQRPGPVEFDGTNGDDIAVVTETVTENSDENVYTANQFAYNLLTHSYPAGSPEAGIFVKIEKEAVDYTLKAPAARVMLFDGSDFYYKDWTEWLAGIMEDHRFVLREGLRNTIVGWIDPMFPFIHTETSKVHRIVSARQDPIAITNTIESIEIGAAE